jgi:hypothetical protein
MCKEATKTTKTIAAATGAITALTADSWALQLFCFIQRREFQKITAQQTQVHLRLSWGSVHGS